MPGRIRQSDVDTVRERTAIESVVSEFVALRPAGGGQLKGLCPFHDERSPSFSVSPNKGLFHCFGCGKGGDTFRFLQEIDHLSFTEAVERLAGRAGVELTYEGGSSSVRGADRGQRTRLVEAHAEAAAFYAQQLAADSDAAAARRFLAERGFDAASAAHFGVGFAPKGWDALTTHLVAKGLSRDDLVTAGLSRESSRGSLIDRFRGRVLWPIRDLGGDVVGFGARKLFDDDTGPKYLNTPETPLFKKSKLLYGVHLAKGDIAKQRQAVIVEGYTDVMACHLAGVTTAVATCGTSFGEDHVGMLRRLLMDADDFRGEVVFTFDGDAAGQKAALRAAELDQRFSAHTYVAVAPGGQDPCDLRQSSGDAAVRDLVAKRVPLVEFVIKAEAAKYDLNNAGARIEALDKVVPLLRDIKDDALRRQYVDIAARILGFVDTEPVRDRLRGNGNSGNSGAGNGNRPDRRPGRPVTPAATPPAERATQAEVQVLAAAVQWPAFAEGLDDLPPSAFTHEALRAAYGVVIAVGGVGAGATMRPDAWAAALLEGAPDDRVRDGLMRLLHQTLPVKGEAQTRVWVFRMVQSLRRKVLSRQIEDLTSRQLRLPPEDPEYAKLTAEIFQLQLAHRALAEQTA